MFTGSKLEMWPTPPVLTSATPTSAPSTVPVPTPTATPSAGASGVGSSSAATSPSVASTSQTSTPPVDGGNTRQPTTSAAPTVATSRANVYSTAPVQNKDSGSRDMDSTVKLIIEAPETAPLIDDQLQ